MRNPEMSAYDPSTVDRAWTILQALIKKGEPIDQDKIYKAINETTPELKNAKDARSRQDRSRLIAVLNEKVEKEIVRQKRVAMEGARKHAAFIEAGLTPEKDDEAA